MRVGDREPVENNLRWVNVLRSCYGVTSEGGLHGRGVVFSMTTAGIENVIYSFGATATDASAPDGTLLNLGGVLYGTSYYGGTNNHGTVYQVTTAGAENVVYSF